MPRLAKRHADQDKIPCDKYLEETNDEAVALLGETNWMNSSVEELKPVRNKFCLLVNIPVPQLVKKPVQYHENEGVSSIPHVNSII